MVSFEPSTPSIRSAHHHGDTSEHDSPKAITDFMDEQVEWDPFPTRALRERSRTTVSSSNTPSHEAKTPPSHLPTIRLKPRYGNSSSLWSANPNASPMTRDLVSTQPLTAHWNNNDVNMTFTSQRLLELRAGDIPNTLFVPFDF